MGIGFGVGYGETFRLFSIVLVVVVVIGLLWFPWRAVFAKRGRKKRIDYEDDDDAEDDWGGETMR